MDAHVVTKRQTNSPAQQFGRSCLPNVRQIFRKLEDEDEVIVIGKEVKTIGACCKPMRPFDGYRDSKRHVLNRRPAQLRFRETTRMRRKGLMFAVDVRKGLLDTRYLSIDAGRVQIATIGVDAQTLRIITMTKSGAIKDGLLASLEGRVVIVFPTNSGEKNAGNRTFCALADIRICALEDNVEIRGKGLKIRNVRTYPLHGTEKDMELTVSIQTLHICETVKFGRIVADFRFRDDTVAPSSHSYLQVTFGGVSLPTSFIAELEEQLETTGKHVCRFLVENAVVHQK